MTIVGLLVALIIICLIFWAVRTLLATFSIGNPIAGVVQVILVVLVILWLVGALAGGTLGSLSTIRLR